MLKDFRQFILRGNVVDLAVGVIIGAAFNSVVTSMVKDILTPLIAAVVGKPDFSALHITLHNSAVTYGNFLNALVSFLIVASVVFFFVVKPINKLTDLARSRQAPEDPTTKKCPECLSEIPVGAKRCAFCTSVQPTKKKAA